MDSVANRNLKILVAIPILAIAIYLWALLSLVYWSSTNEDILFVIELGIIVLLFAVTFWFTQTSMSKAPVHPGVVQRLMDLAIIGFFPVFVIYGVTRAGLDLWLGVTCGALISCLIGAYIYYKDKGLNLDRIKEEKPPTSKLDPVSAMALLSITLAIFTIGTAILNKGLEVDAPIKLLTEVDVSSDLTTVILAFAVLGYTCGWAFITQKHIEPLDDKDNSAHDIFFMALGVVQSFIFVAVLASMNDPYILQSSILIITGVATLGVVQFMIKNGRKPAPMPSFTAIFIVLCILAPMVPYVPAKPPEDWLYEMESFVPSLYRLAATVVMLAVMGIGNVVYLVLSKDK